MNKFVATIKKILKMHGVSCNYTTISTGVYDIDTGSVVNTETITVVNTYPKVLKANQFHYPNLIGKEAVVFYLDATEITPRLEDVINWDSKSFKIEEVIPHTFNGEVVIYKAIGVK